MFKFAPYSFSKINMHKQCNRKFKYGYIVKAKREQQDRTALLKGGAVHSILEKHPEESTHKLERKLAHTVLSLKIERETHVPDMLTRIRIAPGIAVVGQKERRFAVHDLPLD